MVFGVLQVSFLSTGHTHKDIDQVLSSTTLRLKSNNPITLVEPYRHQTTVTAMESVAIISELFD